MARVSVILPARREPYLRPTVVDVLRQARGDVEVIAILDGWWPDPPLPDDPRLKVLHWGSARGLRPGLNAAVEVATGAYIMKLDAHCAVSEGFDVVLAGSCPDDGLVVPEKYSLCVEDWSRFREPWHYFWLTYPWWPELPPGEPGLHDKAYGPDVNAERADRLVDETLSYQGSCWMIPRALYQRWGGMDAAHYYYAQEPQELGLKAWCSGGSVQIDKRAWYAHLHKGRTHRREFARIKRPWKEAIAWSARYWWEDRWPERTRSFRDVIERFLPMPTWPDDPWSPVHRETFEARGPMVIT